ncbi:PilZ domain-containing protein, partial [Myxococcota bacterium]|nr:PilZ domain-containing protein [Myxococcota bacterium]
AMPTPTSFAPATASASPAPTTPADATPRAAAAPAQPAATPLPTRALPPRHEPEQIDPLPATTVEIVEPLEGDETDLDYELELDDEIDLDAWGDSQGESTRSLAPPGAETPRGAERRESTRVAYSQRVVALDEQAARVVVGRDLSAGGMRIAPHPELVVGDVVKLALHAGSETAPLVVLAGVERDDGEDGLLLAFAALTPSQRERLDEILTATSAILSTDPLDEGAPGQPIVMGEVLRRVVEGHSTGRLPAST